MNVSEIKGAHMKKILRKEENKIWRSWMVRKQKWSVMMFQNHYEKISFTSMMLLDPIVVVLLLYYLTGILFSYILAYLLIDTFIYIWWQERAEKRIREEEMLREQGDRTEIIRQKIEELKEIERQIKEEQNANPERKKRKWH